MSKATATTLLDARSTTLELTPATFTATVKPSQTGDTSNPTGTVKFLGCA